MSRGSAESASAGGVIDAFTDALWMEHGLSAHTLAAYRSDLGQFLAWLGGEESRLLQVERGQVLEYLAQRVRAGARPRTTARLLSTLRRFYRHQLREGRIAADPTALVDAPKL